MSINWKVRLKNPVFWVQVVVALFAPILVYFGLNWEDMTTWGAVLDVLSKAVQNPVVMVSVLVSLWNAVNDPTTAGLRDSARALGYIVPSKE